MKLLSLLGSLTILLLALVWSSVPIHATEQSLPPKNLFAPQVAGQISAAPRAEPSLLQQAMGYVRDQQRSLYRQLAGSLRSVKSEYTAATAATLIALSFLYGVFHAAGPGHGKAVISAYLLANERAVKRGIGLSFAASLAQAASAILLVSTIIFLLKGLGITTKQSLSTLEITSAGLIVVIGAWMLWSSLRALGRQSTGSRSTDRVCEHSHHVHPKHGSGDLSWANAGSIVAAVGLRPCSGAIFVLLFANTIGLYAAGIWSTLAMAIGTAITVSLLAIVTLWSKRAAFRLARVRSRSIEWAYHGVRIAGSLAVLLVGALLLFAAASPQPPFPLR